MRGWNNSFLDGTGLSIISKHSARTQVLDVHVCHLGLLDLRLVQLHAQNLSSHSLETQEHLKGRGSREGIREEVMVWNAGQTGTKR